jgi:hypothetical protein
MASAIPLPPGLLTNLNVTNTIGALHIGTYIAVSLFGLVTIQVYYYYLHHSGDGLYIKATVRNHNREYNPEHTSYMHCNRLL